jgi:hypothetical protein
MKNYVVNIEERSIKFSISTGEFLREYLEQLFEDKFGYHPMLQESEDDGLEMYLHTDSYETLNESELAQLEILGVTESDSLSAICSIFSIEIEQWADEEIASCSKCGKDYHENDVNMIDYDDDVCKNCLPQYIESLIKNLHKGTNNLSLELSSTESTATQHFVAVYSFGGIIQSPEFCSDLRELALNMREFLGRVGFDNEIDDARIFKMNASKSVEVYSYQEAECLLLLDELEILNEKEEKIEILNRKDVSEDMIVCFDPETVFNIK